MKKNILLVGASGGIGNAIFHTLKKEHTLYTISRKGTEGSEHDMICDILNQPLPDLDGPLDGLVYSPGSITLKPFRGLKESDFIADFEINVLGAVRVLQHYLKNLQASSSASIVLFSTVAVSRGMPFHASVAAAKAAVEGLTRSLAAEYAPRMRFNVVAPSLTDTPLATKLLRNDKQRESAAERHPLKRTGTAEEISDLVVFLLSDRSSWITGQTMHIDGGLSTL